MIRAVLGHGGGEAAFLAAANAHPLPGIELASAWYAFGKGQPRGANGWHFFAAGEDEEPFALALRGGTAWACGRHDPEELGEFLRWAGVSRLTARLSDQSPGPDGFIAAGRMLGLLRPYDGGGQSAIEPDAQKERAPLFPAGYRLAGQTDAARAADFLRREGAFSAEEGPAPRTADAAEAQAQQDAARLFAQELDARAAVGLGYAALLTEDGAPQTPPRPAAAMVVTTAVFAKAVCLSALQVRAELRGQGLGSRMVQLLAAEAERYARGVCLLCRPERAGFYARLGFVPEGEYACFVPVR